MNQRRATILAVACLGLFYDFLVFTLPPVTAHLARCKGYKIMR